MFSEISISYEVYVICMNIITLGLSSRGRPFPGQTLWSCGHMKCLPRSAHICWPRRIVIAKVIRNDMPDSLLDDYYSLLCSRITMTQGKVRQGTERWLYRLLCDFVVTDRVRREGKTIGSVRLSVRLFRPLCLLNRLTFELLSFVYVHHENIACLGLKIKVKVIKNFIVRGRGHRSRPKVNVQRVWAW